MNEIFSPPSFSVCPRTYLTLCNFYLFLFIVSIYCWNISTVTEGSLIYFTNASQVLQCCLDYLVLKTAKGRISESLLDNLSKVTL